MSRSPRIRPSRTPSLVTALVAASVVVAGVAVQPAQAALAPHAAPAGMTAPAAAVAETPIAWVEVEDGVITGGPAFNSGDHGNFSGTGSYTFRETGMTSTMTVNAPAAGTYPLHVRYAAGPLGADENVTRSMGVLTNGVRQQVSYPMTSLENWEAWRFATTEVTLNQGANTVAIQCDRSVDFCRLNFDAIQVGGATPDPCPATPPEPGWTRMFDGTLDSFDGWRKAGAGGFGRQVDCTIQGLRGRGATWFVEQQSAPYTLRVDWRRNDSNDDSSVYVASSSRGGADPVGGYRIPIGSDTGAIVPTGGTAQAPDTAAVAGALRPVGQWNTYTIQLTGSRLRVLLNGTLVNSLDRPGGAGASGHIGLENLSDADRVSFRNIQVRPDVDLGRLARPFRRAVAADGVVNPGGESTLGNLVAEAQRWATSDAASGTAKIAFVSPTSLGSDLVGTPGASPAIVTHRQATQVQPIADPLVNLRLTGTRIKTVLEQQWQRTAGGTVPALGFLRLGTSAGFTYTYDPTAAEGSHVTGMWLGGVPLSPTGSYSVTVTASLAAGGDNFHEFLNGTGRRDTTSDSQSSLAGYVEAFAGGDPLAPELAQHAVGVSFPGGPMASYAAGSTLEVDLTSLSFTAPADVTDEWVDVTVGGRSIGSFPVDNTLGADLVDETGRSAVRATLPADLPLGATTVRIVGHTTGTTVQLPITVTAAAEPTPGPTPEPTPPPTGAPLPTPTTPPVPTPPAPAPASKSTPTLTAKVRPAALVAGSKARVKIALTASGHTPTGKVTVRIGSKKYVGTLSRGRVTIALPRFAKAGKVTVKISYAGDAATTAVSRTVKLRVKKAGR